jgi:hypothetical protein
MSLDLTNTQVIHEEAGKAMEAKIAALVARYPDTGADMAAQCIALMMQLHTLCVQMMMELTANGEPRYLLALPMLQKGAGIVVQSVCAMAGIHKDDAIKFAEEVTTIIDETSRSVEEGLKTAEALSEKIGTTMH